MTDSAGNIKAESDYYPWGGELQFVNNDSNHYKFTGKERDTESGLDYFGARYYSNGLSRFITPDWAAKAIDVPYAEFSDPQSLNLYSYVRNVPTTRFDPDGHNAGVLTGMMEQIGDELGISAAGWSLGSVALPGLIGGGLAYVGINIYPSGIQTKADAEMRYQTAINNLGILINEMARKGKSTEQLRKEWEKLTGQKWPKDRNTGKNQDCCHKKAKADGGADTAENVEPKTHDDHVNDHKAKGNFKRWGKRAHEKSSEPTPEPSHAEPPKPEPPKPEPPSDTPK